MVDSKLLNTRSTLINNYVHGLMTARTRNILILYWANIMDALSSEDSESISFWDQFGSKLITYTKKDIKDSIVGANPIQLKEIEILSRYVPCTIGYNIIEEIVIALVKLVSTSADVRRDLQSVSSSLREEQNTIDSVLLNTTKNK